jgi:carbamoyltransferase
MNILGLSFGHDGTACVVKNGILAAAISTERITREKKARGVNKKTIKYVLDKAGVKFDDIDMVSVSNWFWDRGLEGAELFDKTADEFSITNENGIELSEQDYATLMQNTGMVAQGVYTFSVGDQTKPCFFLDHHFSHCAYSYFMSPYTDGVSLSIDFADNIGASHAVYYFNDENTLFRPLRRGGDFAIGSYYGQICDFLGFYPSLTDAGKVMALAAYGEPNKGYKDFSWPNVVQNGDLFHGDMYVHTLSRSGIKNFPDQRVFFPQLKGEGGTVYPEWLDKKDWKKTSHQTIAATAQSVLEESIYNLVEKIYKSFGNVTENLTLAGGTNLNCVSNGKLLNSGLFKNVFLAPAAGDDGLCIGGALFLSTQLGKNKEGEVEKKLSHKKMHSVKQTFEGGRSYSEAEISEAIEKSSVDAVKLSDKDVVDKVVDYIDDGKVVGWFQGGSELGPRALGHRSILGDARNRDMKNTLNNKVKHREEFRPFAPVVTYEESNKWFELNGKASPFMLYSVKCKQPKVIPSGVHIDDTARVQTVTKEDNERFYDLVKEFGEKTGVPVIINTSFNVQGEPIVENPSDAIKCFLGTDIDVLVLENFIIEKK